jgi:hypothetical protein
MLGKQISAMVQTCCKEMIYINLLSSLVHKFLKPRICISKGKGLCLEPVAYPGILFRGVQQIQLKTGQREQGFGGGSLLLRGSAQFANE